MNSLLYTILQCDVIVNKDKGVSRIHAEIIIDASISTDNIKKKSSKLRIKDCSKYGTFITNPVGSNEKVHEFPNKETTMDDEDLELVMLLIGTPSIIL